MYFPSRFSARLETFLSLLHASKTNPRVANGGRANAK